MQKAIRSKLTFANVVALMALFIALGGSAYAVSRNSVGPRQLRSNAVITPKIRNNAVTAAKLRGNAVTTNKLRDDAVTTNKIADDAVTGDKVNEASLSGVTPSGPAGGDLTGTYPSPTIADSAVTSAKIQNGQVLATDLGPAVVRMNTDTAVPNNSSSLVLVVCQSGERAIAGGGQWSGTINEAKYIQASVPGGGNLWQTSGRNESGAARDFTAYALCLQ